MMIKKIKTLYEAIKFEHTIFALPFAYLVGIILHLDLLYWLGLVVATVLLVYEHRLVNPSDLSKLNVAFFNMNGYIAVIVFLCTCLAIYVPWP